MLDNINIQDSHSSTTSLLTKSQKLPLTTCSQIKYLTIKYFQTHTHLTKTDLTTYLTEVGLSSDWSTDEEKNCLWEYFTKSNPSQPHVDLENVLSVIDYIFSKDNGDISIDYDALEYDSDNNECSSLHISQLTDNIPQPQTYANIEGYINIIHSKSLLVFIKLINEILCYQYQCKDKETIVINNIKEFYIRIKERYRFILISKKEFDKYFKVITCIDDDNALLHATTTTTQVKVNIDRNVINFVNQLLNAKLLSNANIMNDNNNNSNNNNDNTLSINYSEGNLNINKYGSVISYKHIVDKIKYYDEICLDYINALNEFRTNDIIFNILINSFTNLITSKKSFYEQALTSIANIDQQCHHRKSVSMPNNNTLHCKHPLHGNNTVVYRNDLFFSVNTQFEFDDYRQRSNTKIDKKKKTKFHASKSNNTMINDDSSRKENTIVKLEEYTFSNDDMFSKGDTTTEKYLFETTQMNETNMLINDDNENKKSKGIFSSHNYSIQGDNEDDVNQNQNESFTHSHSKCKVNNNIQCDNNIQMSLNVDTSINKNVYLNNNNSIKEEDDEYNPKNDSIGNNSVHNNNNNNNNNNSAMLVHKQNVHCCCCYCYCSSSNNNIEQFQRENYLQQDTLNAVNKCSPLYYYYDFLSLHNHHSITQILSTKGDNIIPNELFSDDMFYINDKGKYKKIKLAITSSAFYLFKKDSNNQYILLQYYKQTHLQHIIISSLNNNIISFIFQDNTNPYFIVITFKRFELLFYLRDLYHIKKYGNIKCYNFNDYEEFNGEFVQRFKTYRKRFVAAEKTFRVPSFENSIKSGFLLVYYKNFFSCCFYEKYVVLSSIGLMIFDEPFKLPEIIIPLMGVKLGKKRVIIFQQKCLFCFKLILTCQQPITSFLFGSRNSQECEQWRSKLNVYLDLHKTKMKSLNIIQNVHLNTYTHSFSNTLSNYFG